MAISLTFFAADDASEAVALADPRNGIAYTQPFLDACEAVSCLTMRGANYLIRCIPSTARHPLPSHPSHYVAEIDRDTASAMASLPVSESEYHHGFAAMAAWYLAAACGARLFVLIES